VLGILCAGLVSPLRFDEPVVEHDGELGLSLAPRGDPRAYRVWDPARPIQAPSLTQAPERTPEERASAHDDTIGGDSRHKVITLVQAFLLE
jgi:hypothetical protein